MRVDDSVSGRRSASNQHGVLRLVVSGAPLPAGVPFSSGSVGVRVHWAHTACAGVLLHGGYIRKIIISL